MLDFNTAQLVMEAVNKELGNDMISLEEACRMQPIPHGIGKHSSCTILALQRGAITILVWVQVSKSMGVVVTKVKDCVW